MKENRQLSDGEVKKLEENFGGIPAKEGFRFMDNRLREVSRLVAAYKKGFVKLAGDNGKVSQELNDLRDFRKQVFEILTKAHEKPDVMHYSEVFSGYFAMLDEMSGGLRKTIRRKELLRKYPLNSNDNPAIWLKKISVNAYLTLRTGMVSTENLFRKLFGKDPKPTDVHMVRRIPYQGMVAYYLGLRFAELMLPSVQKMMKGISKIYQELWKFDETLDVGFQADLSGINKTDQDKAEVKNGTGEVFDRIDEILTDLRRELKVDVAGAERAALAGLDDAMAKVSTPELPANRFQPQKSEHRKNVLESRYAQELRGWNNTHNTLLDDWTVDVEISLLYFSVLVHFESLKQKVNNFISEHLTLDFGQLRQFLEESAKRIEDASDSAGKIAEVLDAERQKVNEVLIDGMLTHTVEKLTGSLTDDLEYFKNRTLELANKVSDRRGFVKSQSYDRAIRSSEINWISPRDLVGFEALPHFAEAVKKIMKYVEERMEKARVKLLAMGTVSDFSLESARMMIGEKKGAVKTTGKIAVEGYERALAHLHEASELIAQIRKEPLTDLQKAIHDFNQEIQKLKNTDNIFELNLRIARIRAVERSKKARKEIGEWIRNFVPRTGRYLRDHWSKLFGYFAEMKSRMGIIQEKQQISYELTEFITQTETALRRLPFVYQRLYQLTPTDEDRFFVNRQNELSALREAFNDWQKDRFVTTAVIGEKGSGVTSFLNFFIRKIDTELPVIHFTPERKVYTREQYLKLFAGLFDQDTFESNEEIITYLNGSGGYRIVIIENLHHFFLRQVHGFECQRMIFDLMANTSKKVFWVGSYTTHSWEYLEKALRISDHFVRDIRLERLNDETIEEIIFKRNHLSGYRILFEVPKENQLPKNFRRMTVEEQQQYLRGQFFAALNQISNGNVSLAQLYWLRSTRGVTDDTIRIEPIREIDVSFVKDITSDYLFALYTMLVHDGMTLSDYTRIFYKSESSSRNTLVPMLEKGLLIKPKEKYNINPIVFRQVVNLLRSRNFIN